LEENKMNISFEEYTKRLLEIRRKVNELLDDIGTTYSTAPADLERLLNIAMNGWLDDTNGDKIKTTKLITVKDWTKSHIKPEYM
jgi:hypothetical protein